MIKAYFDGCCMPNADGGRMGYGAVILQHEEIIHTTSHRYRRSDKMASNNIAEYCGCIAVLTFLLSEKLDTEEIYIFGDSQLVINQMAGKWEAREGKYLEYHATAINYLSQFYRVPLFEWIPRERNHVADRLASIGVIDRD